MIGEKPLPTLIQTRNLLGEGWSAQVAHDGECLTRSDTAQFLDRHSRIRLLEKTDDLFFRKSALLHARHSP